MSNALAPNPGAPHSGASNLGPRYPGTPCPVDTSTVSHYSGAPYSVVLPVYAGDEAAWFATSLQSVLDQTQPSDDVIVVVNGAIPEPLAALVSRFTEQYPQVGALHLAQNLGTGAARNHGIRATKHELVAVQDADDVSLPNRMALLTEALLGDADLVMVGGQIGEFAGDDPLEITSYRRVPTSAAEVEHFAHKRMPVNGPTLMFRKTPVLAVGGYGEGTRSEDYLLIARLLASGAKINNIPEVVLHYRAGPEALARRRTWNHFRGFVATRIQVKRLGIGSWLDVAIPCAAQLALTITPQRVTELFYKKVLR